MWDKDYFLHEDNYQRFLQADAIIFTGRSQACPEYPKQRVCNIFSLSQKQGERLS